MSEFVTKPLIDEAGEMVGSITDVIANPFNLEPEFAVVKIGRFGGEHLIPLGAVEPRNGEVVAQFSKQHIKETPKVRHHTAPTSEERIATYEHYGLPAPASEGTLRKS